MRFSLASPTAPRVVRSLAGTASGTELVASAAEELAEIDNVVQRALYEQRQRQLARRKLRADQR
jgi:hypothetical protein